MRRLSLWVPVVVYMAAIFYVSSESNPFPSVAPLVWDKAVHFTEYAILGLLWCRALRGEGLSWAAAIVIALVAASAYGASDEWHQSFVAFRDTDVHDWYADTIGASIGLALYLVGITLRRRSSASQ